MAAISRLKFVHLALLSKPKAQRWLWRYIRRHRVANIVQFGVGDARKSRQLIEVAQRYAANGDVRYTGTDLFEAGSDRVCLPLKEAHRRLAATGAKIRLVPGNPLAALRRTANALSGTQLLLISADTDEAALQQAWFYVPRMLAEESLIVQERHQGEEEIHWQRIERSQIESLARSSKPRQAA